MNQTLLGSESSPSNTIAAASYDYDYYDFMNKFISPLDSNTKYDAYGKNKGGRARNNGKNSIKRNDYGHSGYGDIGGYGYRESGSYGYGDSGSYGYGDSGSYGYGHQNNIKLNFGNDFKIKVPSIPKKAFEFPLSTMFKGITKVNLKFPNIKLGSHAKSGGGHGSYGGGGHSPTGSCFSIDICPDIILAALAAAAAAAAFLIYQAIVLKGRRRKRETDDGILNTMASFILQFLYLGTLIACLAYYLVNKFSMFLYTVQCKRLCIYLEKTE